MGTQYELGILEEQRFYAEHGIETRIGITPASGQETWRPFHKIEVSDLGRIRGVRGKILKLNKDKSGYPITRVRVNGVKKPFTVHSIVMAAFVGERPIDPNTGAAQFINHIDGCKTNNTLTNLEYCTASANVRHAVRMKLKTGRRGSHHPKSKLRENDVHAIRDYLRIGWPGTQIARKFDISSDLVYRIRDGKAWAWLAPNGPGMSHMSDEPNP